MAINKLTFLYKAVDSCKTCKAKGNKLKHIHGFGAKKPRFMFVLVNPTHRNISSKSGYKGKRFPFIGVRQFWRVLADGGLINKPVAYSLPPRSEWSAEDTRKIEKELLKNKIFLTNIVKCCYPHANYPEEKIIQNHLKFLAKEIRIIKPKKIIAFGALVYEKLTGRKIKLSDCFNKKILPKPEIISGLNTPTFPCYFPTGRGSPKKAETILRKLK